MVYEPLSVVLIEGAVGGAVLALIAFLLSRFVSDVAGRTLLATVLFAAAGAYFGFAFDPKVGPVWLLAPRKWIDQALETIRLTRDANRRVREYSLGMRQRLGLALALLNRPELLILDEPTNGLDPAGIHEMRDLIRRLPEEFGATVFLSSHLLSEVEQIASHIGIIHESKLLFQGTLAELQQRQHTELSVGVTNPDEAFAYLVCAGWSVERRNGLLSVSTKDREDAVKINRLLVDHHLDVFHLSLSQRSLEDIFLTLTNRQSSEKIH